MLVRIKRETFRPLSLGASSSMGDSQGAPPSKGVSGADYLERRPFSRWAPMPKERDRDSYNEVRGRLRKERFPNPRKSESDK